MAKQLQYSFIVSSIFLGFLVVPIISAQNYPFFIFGDSILDAGNNNYINTTTLGQANFYPYGITFFHFPTGRHSDGRLICDFIAEYANLPLIPPFLQPGRPRFYNGVNFASAGAGALVQTYQHQVIDLHMQLRNYKKVEYMFRNKFGDVQAKKKLSNAVYLFSVAGNDYSGSFLELDSSFMSTFPKTEYVNMVIGNMTEVITEIYKSGGRKFALMNTVPLGCLPLARILDSNGDCIKEPLEYAVLHNNALGRALKGLEMKLPGFKYSLYDLYTSVQLRIDYPSQYGYEDGKSACCGTGNFRGVLSCGGKRPVKEFELCENVADYVFWDSAHFTEETYRQLADDMWNSRSFGSYTVKDLFHMP